MGHRFFVVYCCKGTCHKILYSFDKKLYLSPYNKQANTVLQTSEFL